MSIPETYEIAKDCIRSLNVEKPHTFKRLAEFISNMAYKRCHYRLDAANDIQTLYEISLSSDVATGRHTSVFLYDLVAKTAYFYGSKPKQASISINRPNAKWAL